MKFDMNRAWNDATAMVAANRELLLVVAGVFILLPALASAFLFSDYQAQAFADLQDIFAGKAPNPAAIPSGQFGYIFGLSLVLALFQMVGYMAQLALLTDAQRPTVGEAIMIAFRSLPSLFAATVLFVLGYGIAIAVVVLVLGALAAVVGSGAGFIGLVSVIVYLVSLAYVCTKLSLTLAVIVIEGTLNPVAALIRSWKLTKGNSFRLFGFYFLLMLLYFVISLLLTGLIGLFLAAAIANGGTIATIFSGVLSGGVAAAVSVLFTGLIAAIHRQLAGSSASYLAETFE